MNSIQNLSCIGSMTIHTLREGSVTERIVLGTVLLATGAFVAIKITQMVSRFFGKPQQLPKNYVLSQKEKEDLEKRLKEKYPVVSPKNNPVLQTQALLLDVASKDVALNNSVLQTPAHSLLESLILNGLGVTEQMEVPLAIALHAYQELKTEIGGDDDRFFFLAMSYLQDAEFGLPSVIGWEAKSLELKIPAHYNSAFAELEEKLGVVGLSLKNLIQADIPIALARFKNGTDKEIHDLPDLYQTVKLHGPHILSSFEVAKAKIQLHESRLKIIDKILSTLRAVLINDFVASFGEKHKELYTIFGSKPETLKFVLENICWHALDRVFETVETTFIPSKEAQLKARKIEFEAQLVRVLKDEVKLKQAEVYLLEILTKPDNDKAMETLVKLLAEEGTTPERDLLVKKLQTSGPQFQEESAEKELERLHGVQKFYHTVRIAAAVADEGKNALLQEKGDIGKREKITLKQLSSPLINGEVRADNRITYAKQIDGLSKGIVQAGREAVEEVAGQKWNESLLSLDEELKAVPKLSPEICQQIVEQGWVKFDQRQALLPISGEHRWLITKKMIVQKLAKDSLQQNGKELLQEVSKKGSDFFKTLYRRLVTAFLAFDQRTRDSSEEGSKPADCIARTFFDSVLQCHQALGQVHKVRPYDAGSREDGVIKELEDNGDMHPSAVNKPSADVVFLGQLILQLLSVLQPKGLTEDIRDVLAKSLINPGEAEPTFFRSVMQKYNDSIRPAAEPWVKPVGVFLGHALQNIIEKKSTHNFASQLSDLLDPVNINALLIDILKDDDSAIQIVEQASSGYKDRLKWYGEDEEFVIGHLKIRSELDAEIKGMEKRLEEVKKVASGESLESLTQDLVSLKMKLAILDLELVPQLFRRLVIANVPSKVAGYVVQFTDDVFELMQYPRILRHIVFNVLEKSVHALAKPLEENAELLLDDSINVAEDQSVFDFLFSNRLKTSIGDKIVTLFSSVSSTDNQWDPLVWIGQTVAKRILPGYSVFTGIQGKIEELIQKKFDDREAANWSAAKLVVTMNRHILTIAQDQSDEGMKAVIATQLKKVIGLKEESKVDEKNGRPKTGGKSVLTESKKTHNISKKSGNESKTQSKPRANLNVGGDGTDEGFVFL